MVWPGQIGNRIETHSRRYPDWQAGPLERLIPAAKFVAIAIQLTANDLARIEDPFRAILWQAPVTIGNR